jgi:hypothetical protein
MNEQLKNTYNSTGFNFQRMSNEEINKITKQVPLEEDVSKYTYPQNLFLLQLQRKVEIQFRETTFLTLWFLLVNGLAPFY